MKQNFIKTSDASVAAELRKNGFTSVGQEGKMFVFINDGKIKFSEETKKKIVFSDIICI